MLCNHFRSDPAEAGWQLLQFDWVNEPAAGRWVPGTRASDGGSLSVENGYWQSPRFATVPHRYYRLTFQSKAQLPGYWAAMFFTPDGKVMQADHNSAIFESEDWIDNEFYFQGKEDAVSAVLRFYPTSPEKGKTIRIRDVKLAEATDAEVLDWADRLYATLPPVTYEPSPGRWALIPRTMQKLRNGQTVRIVILGDSIGNDTGNSPVDKLIQRQYPGSRVEVITAVRGGTGCRYYQQENRVQEYVVRYAPDLVMIIAISHKYDLDAIRNVIRQIREKCDAEIILTTGPISQESVMTRDYARARKVSIEKAAAARKAFLESVEKLANEEQVEFIDLRRLWNDYMATATQSHDVTWFMRDETHANVRGRQVVARMLEKYFAPE